MKKPLLRFISIDQSSNEKSLFADNTVGPCFTVADYVNVQFIRSSTTIHRTGHASDDVVLWTQRVSRVESNHIGMLTFSRQSYDEVGVHAHAGHVFERQCDAFVHVQAPFWSILRLE